MGVDRRVLRRFPGRKRRGRGRPAQPSIPPALSVAERLGLAVSCNQLVDAETLRNCFEYDQATLLRTFDADRRARIRAVHAIFVQMGVDHFDPVKRLVWTYLDTPLAWQFLADAGWSDCDAATQVALNNGERNCLETVDCQFRAWNYRYWLTTMSQVNLNTGKVRPLRRCSPWGASALPRWQYETQFGWSDCDLSMQGALADALREAESEETTLIQRVLRSAVYEFDFVALTQINVHTRRVRALRFGPPVTDGAWSDIALIRKL